VTRVSWLIVPVVAGLLSTAAEAQTVDVPLPRRLEAIIGAGWLAGAAMGSPDANLRAAEADRAPLRLFGTDNEFAAASTIQLGAGVALNRRFGIEGGVTLSHPEVRTSLRDDLEGAPAITVAERIDQYGVDAGLVFMVHELGIGGRTLPFVTAGVGYLRQLHEGRTVVEQGHFYYAGGGIKHWLMARNAGLVRGAGLRADARMYFMADGISFDDGPRSHAAISGSLFLTF
jgi:hypothetical protein